MFLVQDGSIVEWKARPSTRLPGPHGIEGVITQRLVMMSLAKKTTRRSLAGCTTSLAAMTTRTYAV
ncbi:MAG TPA: hypothetical protein VF016_06330 [Nitrososphaera sp.]